MTSTPADAPYHPPPSPSPLDPNFSPPTRPPSALSTTSDGSFFELYEEAAHASSPSSGPSSGQHYLEHLPRRVVFSTIRRHGQRCLLCGRAGDLVVVRVLLQHAHHESGEKGPLGEGRGTGPDIDPISALKVLGLLPHGYTRDDWTNLMTLCKPHAEAYDGGVWRWLPGSALREQIARTAVPADARGDLDAKTPSVRPGPLADEHDGDGDVTMTEMDVEVAMEAEITVDPAEDEPGHPGEPEDTGTRDSASLAVQVESTPAETLVDDGISGDTKNPTISFQPVELPTFDVLVFRPKSMPPFADSAGSGSSTVWPDWKKLTLNPHVAYSAALHLLLGGPDVYSTKDGLIARLRDECREVGGRWSEALRRREYT